MNEDQEQELFDYLKQNLRLNLKSTSEYMGYSH